MARLEERDYTYFTTVRGMCRRCRQVVPARVFFRQGQVWQQSLCPTCRACLRQSGGRACENGSAELTAEAPPALIAADKDWYLSSAVARASRL